MLKGTFNTLHSVHNWIKAESDLRNEVLSELEAKFNFLFFVYCSLLYLFKT